MAVRFIPWTFGGGGGGGAPVDADYLVLTANAALTNERVATAGTGITITDGGAGGPATFSWDGVTVRKNAGADVGTRRRINFMEGTNVTLTIADDAANGEIDVTINASGGGGGSVTWTEVEVDFGSTPRFDASFTIVDALVSASSKITAIPSGKAGTGRTDDDWQWDGIAMAASPASGQFTLYCYALPGPIVGPRKIQYSIG